MDYFAFYLIKNTPFKATHAIDKMINPNNLRQQSKISYFEQVKPNWRLRYCKIIAPWWQIASAYNILPQHLQNCQKTFLANAEIAMEPAKAVKE